LEAKTHAAWRDDALRSKGWTQGEAFMGLIGLLHALHLFLQFPLVKAFIAGAVGGAVVDYHVFLGFHRWNEFKQFDWNTATLRWVQGGVTTAVGITAYGKIVG
jgi:hypothetical protein